MKWMHVHGFDILYCIRLLFSNMMCVRWFSILTWCKCNPHLNRCHDWCLSTSALKMLLKFRHKNSETVHDPITNDISHEASDNCQHSPKTSIRSFGHWIVCHVNPVLISTMLYCVKRYPTVVISHSQTGQYCLWLPKNYFWQYATKIESKSDSIIVCQVNEEST